MRTMDATFSPAAVGPAPRSRASLAAVALGAATSAVVVAAALAGHSFSFADLVGVLGAAGFILALNLQQVPQRPLLSRMPDRWDREVVVNAPQATTLAQGQAQHGAPHAA